MPDRPEATVHSLPQRHRPAATPRQATRLTPEIGILALHGLLCELRGVLLDLDTEISALRHTREETIGRAAIKEADDQTALDLRPGVAAVSAEHTGPAD